MMRLHQLLKTLLLEWADRLDKDFPKVQSSYLRLKYSSGSYIHHLEVLVQKYLQLIDMKMDIGQNKFTLVLTWNPIDHYINIMILFFF